MTIITATRNQDQALIDLDIEATSPVRRIFRTDANGTRMVRVHPSQLPASGSFNLKDREAALSGEIRYDVDDGAAGASATAYLGLELPWLTIPVLPREPGVQVRTVHGYDAARESMSTFHYPIGRTDPLVTLGEMRTRTGRLKMFCADHAAVARLYRLSSRGEVMFLRQAEHLGLDMYFIPSGDAAEPVDGGWEYSADYVELAWPADPMVTTPGWTFADLKESADTFETVTERYLDFNHLERDERI